MSIDAPVLTPADWAAAQAKTRRLNFRSVLASFVVFPGLLVLAMLVGEALAEGAWRFAVAAGFLLVVMVPAMMFLYTLNVREQRKVDLMISSIANELAEAAAVAQRESLRRDDQARRQQFESRLANALDMAEGEPEVIDVIERSLASTLPDAPVELLLADNSHAHLLRMATSSPTGIAPGCSVDSPDRCPAARRAQVQQFSHSDDLDSCPKLRGRAEGALSAVCVPVSVMGRTVGVIHATGAPDASFAQDRVQDLGTLAKLAGSRIGLLRAMAESQLQAATDSLTGLLNRRSFEQRVAVARRDSSEVAIAMADLDKFKELNDTYGHDTGDRALRLFSQVLSGSLRAQDIICRHGGEEFVIALPGCTTESAYLAFEGVRARLEGALTVAGLPKLTVSVGIVAARPEEELSGVIGRADAALFQAKKDGRDRVTVHDELGLAVVGQLPAGAPGFR